MRSTILRCAPAVDLHQGKTATTRACSRRPCYEVGGWTGIPRFDEHWPIAKPAWVHDTVAEMFQSRGQSYEICAEWNGHYCRASYCCARMGSNKRPNESVRAHPIRFDGRAYEDAQDYKAPPDAYGPAKSEPARRRPTRDRPE